MTNAKKQQSGIVLVIGLIMLLLMTLIGVTAMQVTSLEEKMAGNFRNHNVAFQAAESALRYAESHLNSEGETAFNPLSLNGPFFGDDCVIALGICGGGDDLELITDFSTVSSNDMSTAIVSIPVIEAEYQPKFIIELIGVDDGDESDSAQYGLFRVTVRAWGEGDNPTSKVQLQTVYRLKFRSPITI